MARIVVAEDEEGLRGFVVRALALDGHEVLRHINKSGASAETFLRNARTIAAAQNAKGLELRAVVLAVNGEARFARP